MIKVRVDRLAFLLVSNLFALSLHVAHLNYLAVQTHAPGFFNHAHFELTDYLLCFVLISVMAAAVPSKVQVPSTVFAIVLFFLLYVPTVVIVLGNKPGLSVEHLQLLVSLFIGFLVICAASRISFRSEEPYRRSYPSLRFGRCLLAMWLVLGLVLVYKYRSVMGFSGLSNIYMQRELGRAGTLVDGYIQVYFGYFFSALLFSYGLYKRSVLYLVLGAAGCCLLYAITAERTVFMLPFLMAAVYFLVVKENRFLSWINTLALLATILIFAIGIFYEDSKFLYDLGFYFLSRTIVTPGLFLVQYYDFFSVEGYTYWAHVRGLGLILEPSQELVRDPLYPQLGKMVAWHVHGIDSNSNASFLATDGVAAAGSIGLLGISVLFSLYILALNYMGRFWRAEFLVPALSPIAFILTNGSFFTIMLSFGGLAWLIVFFISNSNFSAARLKLAKQEVK